MSYFLDGIFYDIYLRRLCALAVLFDASLLIIFATYPNLTQWLLLTTSRISSLSTQYVVASAYAKYVSLHIAYAMPTQIASIHPMSPYLENYHLKRHKNVTRVLTAQFWTKWRVAMVHWLKSMCDITSRKGTASASPAKSLEDRLGQLLLLTSDNAKRSTWEIN